MRDLEGKPCKERYSDPTDARKTALLQKMKSNSLFTQHQPPAHHFSWPLQHADQPSFTGHTPAGVWSLCLPPGNLLLATIYLPSLDRILLWLGLHQITTEARMSHLGSQVTRVVCLLQTPHYFLRMLSEPKGFVLLQFLLARKDDMLLCYWKLEVLIALFTIISIFLSSSLNIY